MTKVSVIDYQLISTTDGELLVDLVMRLVRKGYDLQGAPFIVGDRFYQCMVLFKTPEPLDESLIG